MAIETTVAAGADRTVAVTSRWYLLAMLTAIYALNIADRFAISTLIEPIKADLALSDTAIGFLTGTVLALFYVSAGLPLATLADRTDRRRMLAIALAFWSAMTAACGLAQTYWQLLLARIGVGIGEAGGTPPSQSLISDRFDWRERPLAMSIFGIGAAIGSMLGALAGPLSDAYGWRAAFLIFGVPGILFALVFYVTVREPPRGALDPGARLDAADIAGTLRFLRTQPAALHCLAAGTVFTFWAWGLMWWTPSYLVRSHGLTLGEAGTALAWMNGVGGTVVLLATAVLLSKFGGREPRLVAWVPAAAVALGTVPSIVAFTTKDADLALAMLWIFVPLSYATFGPAFAIMHNLVPPGMRAQVSAILLFTSNIANLVFAPQLVGLASDALAAEHGSESLRVALIPVTMTGFWAAAHFWLVSRSLRAGMERAGTLVPAGAASGR